MTDLEEKEVPAAGEEPAFYFDAFISYRHADLDSAAAAYLQKALEHYKIPREIQKKCGKKSLRRIFRDEEELGAASDLFGEIEQNLRRSEFLLVICTPRILESKWCLREIETFIKYRGREHVLAVLAEGEPETAFPPILLEEGEPLAADIRGRNKGEMLRHARERMPRLAAPLLHCSYDELYQRHRVYKTRRLAAAAGIVAALSLGFGAVTLDQNQKITENYRGKLENQSQYLARLSEDLLKEGDREAALLVAMEALPKGTGDGSRPYVAEARIALEDALYTYKMDYQYNLRPKKVLEHKGALGNCSDYDPEEGVLLTSDSRVYLWDEADLELITCWDDGNSYKDAKLGGKGRLFLLGAEGIRCVNFRTGEVLWEWTFPDCPSPHCTLGDTLVWDYCRETDTLLCMEERAASHYLWDVGMAVTDRHGIHLIDAATGQSRVWKPAGLYGELLSTDAPWRWIRKAVLSPDGKELAIAWRENTGDKERSGVSFRVLTLDSDGCPVREEFPGLESVGKITWLPDGAPLLVCLAEPGQGIGATGYSTRWQAVCWEPGSWERRFRYEDSCLNLANQVIVETADASPNTEDAPNILSIVYDNVAVNLDLHTGERYSRMEDRKNFILNHIWAGGGLQMLITMDGYVFITNSVEDYVWDPKATAYQYSLDLGTVYKAERIGERVYLYTQKAVYCYCGVVDDGYTLTGKAVDEYWYDSAHSCLAILDYDNVLTLYDTGDFSVRWEESCASSGFGCTAALIDDQYAAFVDPEKKGIAFRALSGGGPAVTVPVEGLAEASAHITVAPGGPGRATLFLGGVSPILQENPQLETEGLDDAALWLVDAGEGKIVRQRSWRELADALPIPPSDRPGEWYFSIAEARPTATGRYLLLACKAESSVFSDQTYKETVLLVWDIQEDRWVTLPQDLCRHLTGNLDYGSYFDNDGWIAPQGDLALLLSEKKELLVVDAGTGEELHRLALEGISGQEVSFTPDGDHILFQDGVGRMQVYNWREGRYTQSMTIPEEGALRYEFHENGELMAAGVKVGAFLSEATSIYRRAGPGEYRKETTISNCRSCDGSTVVIDNDSNSRLYRYYSLDDLLTKAKGLLKGRELTEIERKNYLID